MRLATRMQRLGTETAFEVLVRARALEAQGRDVIHLEIGEPDFDTPANVSEAGVAAIRDGWTHYGPASGQPDLRQTIADYINRSRGTSYGPANVVVTPGGKPIMFFLILALLEEGDDAIFPDPGFPIYRSMIDFVGARAIPLPIREEHDFRLDVDELAALITPQTKFLIINSPANPTGGVLTRAGSGSDRRARRAARSLRPRRRDLLGDHLRRRPSLDRDVPRTARAHRDSRRLLQDVCHDRLAAGLRGHARGSCRAGQPPHGQQRLLHGLARAARRHRGAHRPARHRPRHGERVSAAPRPDGRRSEQYPRYLVPRAGRSVLRLPQHQRAPACRSKEFADRLLDEFGVAALSGTSFGEHGEGYLRLSYANSEENLAKALERIDAAARQTVAVR